MDRQNETQRRFARRRLLLLATVPLVAALAAVLVWQGWWSGVPGMGGAASGELLSTTPVTVSGPSPYASCRTGGAGTRYVNSEVETWLVVNPASLESGQPELLATWMSNRYGGPGASDGLVTAASTDGGRTWTESQLAFSRCADKPLKPDYWRASDPWVSFGPDGTAYAAGLIVRGITPAWEIGVATSADGGKTWSDYQSVTSAGAYSNSSVDKEMVIAHPTRPGTAYLSWTHNMDADPVPQRRGAIELSETQDGGKSWSEPRLVYDPPSGWGGVGSTLLIDPKSGAFYHFFGWVEYRKTMDGESTWQLGFQRSTDDGKTWTEVRAINAVNSTPVRYKAFDEPVRSTVWLPSPALDPRTGRVYLAWEDSRYAGYSEILLTWSDDMGETWTEPIRANAESDLPVFRPALAVNSQGLVGLMYYTVQPEEAGGPTMPADLRFALLTPEKAGLSEPAERVIAGPFDLDYAPKSPGPFVGDYLGVTAVNDWFGLLYVEPTQDRKDPTHVRFVGIRP